MAEPSVVKGVQDYIRAMIDRIPGMKVLILDPETIGIVSMVFSQSEILQKEVFLVERIDAEGSERMRHMNAICLLRPTDKNFILLSEELRQPKYHEYHIFFTNVVPHARLEQLAGCDEHETVQQVQEFFADIYAITHELFSLSMPSSVRLAEHRGRWTSYEEDRFDRIIEGLLAVCLCLRVYPTLRYTASSELTREVAQRLQSRIAEESSIFETIERPARGEPAPVLLILDRRNDPVTPLLNQWTYQAMLHELLGMDNNRIDMTKVPGIRDELREIVMSPTQDSFFEENMLSNFGDLGVSIKKYVEEYQSSTKNTARIESIEEMQRFVDEYPEFRRMSGNVSKHVAVVHELSRIIEDTSLLQASQLEQELACTENRQEHFRAVMDMLKGQEITNMERLRLVLLFSLRYEHDSSLGQLKEVLRSKGIGQEQVALVDQLLQYAGSHIRGGDLFHNKSMFAQAKATVAASFKGVENVYTQHKTQVASIADNLMKGKLKESSFPFADGARYGAPSSAEKKLSRAIIFIVGGATFEEARDVSEVNRSLSKESGRGVILGGTTVHSCKSFLADIAQLGGPHGGPE